LRRHDASNQAEENKAWHDAELHSFLQNRAQ
jgi:hypothetical protein